MSDERCPPKAGNSGQADTEVDDDVSAYPGLSARQGKAIEALLQGQPMNRVALLAGVNGRTVRRWVRRERFRAALLDARRETLSQAVGLTARYAPVAVGTLLKIMNDQLAPPSARVTAAAMMLRFGREGIELEDLAARVEALEREGKPKTAKSPTNGRSQLRLASTEEAS